MLEAVPMLTVTGVIKKDGEFTPIYCDQETGDCAYDDALSGSPLLLSNISVDNPLAMSSLDSLEDKVEDNDLVGIIVRDDLTCITLFTEDKAGERTLKNFADRSGDMFDYDSDCDYEFERELED